MRVAEGGLRSGVDLGIGVLVLVLAAAVALTPSVLGAGFPSRGPARVSSDAVVPAGVATFNPPHFDSGYDANGNGLFDFLGQRKPLGHRRRQFYSRWDPP